MAQKKSFFENASGKRILNYVYSWGAAVVILGALFKILHLPGANLMLMIGMGTEVVIFIISGFGKMFTLNWLQKYLLLRVDKSHLLSS